MAGPPQTDDSYTGFEWIDFRDTEASVISFVRFARDRQDFLVFCCNFTPVPRHNYRIGVPRSGVYLEAFNTDSEMFGGSNVGNMGETFAGNESSHGRPASISITLPPLAVVVFKPQPVEHLDSDHSRSTVNRLIEYPIAAPINTSDTKCADKLSLENPTAAATP